MSRLVLPALLVVASTASAHFPFLVPDGPDKGKAVFSDSLKPDTAGVPVDRIASTKVVVLQDGKGVSVPLTLDKKANCYTFDVPGRGPRVVVGTTEYGVVQRGDSPPFRLQYHAKALFGGVPAADTAAIGEKAPVELVPVVEAGKLRFKALAAGKPMARAQVTVLVPGEGKSKVVPTDDAGLTAAFEAPGQYGAQVRRVDDKPGEQAGKKYAETRHYATLVVTIP